MSAIKKIQEAVKQLMKFADGMETPAEESQDITLADGTIVHAASLEVGQPIMFVTPEGEVPAPVGEYPMQDGSILVITEVGVIGDIMAPVAQVELEELTGEQITELLAKFADGVPANDVNSAIVTCVKALMEYNFSWKINESAREAQEKAALSAYENVLKAQFQALLVEKDEKIAAIEKANNVLIEQHKQTLSQFSALIEQVEVIGSKTAAPISEQKSAPKTEVEKIAGFFSKK